MSAVALADADGRRFQVLSLAVLCFMQVCGFDFHVQVGNLSDEEKERVKNMSVKDLPIQERRKGYNALQRRMNNPVGLKAGVVEEYLACKGQDAKRFELLKNFICDPDMYLISIWTNDHMRVEYILK